MQAEPDYGAIAQEAVKRLKELYESKAWIDNGDKGCKMYKCEINGRIASKGVAKTTYNIDKVVAFLENEDSLKKISPMLKDIKVLKIHEGEGAYRINYMLYAGIWPVDDREFVSVSGKERVGNIQYIATTACPFPYESKNKAVKGEVFVGGYIIEKIGENETIITYISDADLKGSIPGMIKNTLSAKQGEIAGRIEPAMKKDGIA